MSFRLVGLEILTLLSSSPPKTEDHQGNEHKTSNTDSYTDDGAG